MGYVDSLKKWVDRSRGQGRRQDAATVAFLAVSSDVSEALKAGYSKKTIWTHMKETGIINCRYETFVKHTKKYLDDEKSNSLLEKNDNDNDNDNREVLTMGNAKTNKVQVVEQSKGKEFNFDNKANEEDLV